LIGATSPLKEAIEIAWNVSSDEDYWGRRGTRDRGVRLPEALNGGAPWRGTAGLDSEWAHEIVALKERAAPPAEAPRTAAPAKSHPTERDRRVAMKRLFLAALATLALMLALSGTASADPLNSPRISSGTLVCGDVTYTVVSPDQAPVGQMVTANGSNSTSVQIMIVDKAGTHFPRNLLTHCTFIGRDGFAADLLVTPVG
jgi:hypothetical protein